MEIDGRIETMMQRLEGSTISLTDYFSGLSYLAGPGAFVTDRSCIQKIKRFAYVGKVTQNVGKVRVGEMRCRQSEKNPKSDSCSPKILATILL